MKQVSSLVTQKIEMMTEAEDWKSLRSKHKAITALFPYAVLRERRGKPMMLDVFLRAARASRIFFSKPDGLDGKRVDHGFGWWRIAQYANGLFSAASPRAIVLASPHIPWGQLTDGEDLTQRWVVATSAASCTEEVAQSVIDTLLQIASLEEFSSHIPVNLWLWLTKRPSLPPVCVGRVVGNHSDVFTAVQSLKNIEVVKSYLVLAWSEWGALGPQCFDEICTSMREDFGGIGMGSHRTDLIQRLDHILGQLDLGLEHLNRHNPYLDGDLLEVMGRQYGTLRKILLEVERRTLSPMVTIFCILTPAGIH